METPFPAYRGDDPYIFVCYSHEDSAVVFPELERLRQNGVNVYYDEGISPGHEWTQALADAIDGSSRFLYFISPYSAASRHCRNEVQYALDKDKAIVSVHLEPTELPGGLKLSLGADQAILKYNLSADNYQRKLSDTFGLLPHSNHENPTTTSTVQSPGKNPIVAVLLAGLLIGALALFWGYWERAPDTDGQTGPKDPSPPKLAVLPFANLSNDPEQEYFSDGVSEDLLTLLARQKTLVVRARQSSFFFRGRQLAPREIATALDVGYLVDGSVRLQGGRVRVTVRLMDVASNEDIWSRRYDRDLTDVFAVQDEIARSVATELGAQFSNVEGRAVDIAAYDAFLLGRHYYHRQTFDLAAKHFLKAIKLDAAYADAHAHLARVYATEAANLPVNLSELYELVDLHLAKALEIDPALPLALGLQAGSFLYPIQKSIDDLHELVTRYPNNEGALYFYSTKMRVVGRQDLELKILDQWGKVDPLSVQCPIPLLMANLFYGYVDEASRGVEKCEAVGVPYPAAAAHIALLRGDLDTAKRQVRRPAQDWFAVPAFWQSVIGAYVAYAENDPHGVELALEPIADGLNNQSSFVRCQVALLRGELDEALAEFEAALSQGNYLAFYLRDLPTLRKLFPEFYASERYAEILRIYGLDSESVAQVRVPPLPF